MVITVYAKRTYEILLVVGVAVSAALLFLATDGLAFSEPGLTGAWTDFANCPVVAIVPLTGSACEHSYTTGGVVQIGHSSVPISVPGNTFDIGATFPLGQNGIVMAGPHGILNGPAQPIPGGMLGAVGSIQLTGVTAKLEWARPSVSNSVFGFTEDCSGTSLIVTFDICRVTSARNGTAVTLNAKFHLISPFLGPACYIGSVANPLIIGLTTGVTSPPPPARPIHGHPAEFVYALPENRVQVVGLTLVNNSFSVPTASGCGTSSGSLVNAAINHKLGLPSPAGQNSIAINAVAEQAPAVGVLAHGWTGE